MNFTNPKLGVLPYLVEMLEKRVSELETQVAALKEYIKTLQDDGK